MKPQVELLEKIKGVIKKECGLDIALDGLSQKGGLCAELAPGYMSAIYYDKSAIRTMPVLFLSKDKNQKTCIHDLGCICNYLTAQKQYPDAESFSWLDATTATEPNRIGKQEDGQWIYSAIVNMKIYF